MPRLSEKDKTALCSHFTHPADVSTCKDDYDIYSDYQDAKKNGKFSGTLEDWKKQNNTSGKTWTSTTTTEKPETKTPDKKSHKNLYIGIGIGVGFLILGLVAYKTLNK